MDRASIISIEEVCKRCHLYTKHCGMLECPSQCVQSGHFIDGYRKAEKDLALTWEDVAIIISIYEQEVENGNICRYEDEGAPSLQDASEIILQRFNEQREKI